MTRTRLLLTGLLAGAVAFGTACKTDKATTNTGADQTQMTPDSGTGGTGYLNPEEGREGVNPVPDEGTREMEPGVHQGTHPEPGTGGTGLEPEPIDRNDNLGGESTQEPLNPGAPATSPNPEDDTLPRDELTPEPRH